MMDESSSSNPFSGRSTTMDDEETMTSNAGSRMEMISLGGTTTSDDRDDLELQQHDIDDVQHDLPSVEEYKAGLTMGGASSRTPSKASVDLMKENSSQRPVDEDLQQDEPIIHDQLPSVDEIKMNGGAGTNNNHCFRNFALFLLAIAVIVAVAVPVLIMTKEDRENSGSTLFGQPPRVMRLNRLHNYLDTMDVSKKDALTTAGTPQYWASMWMAGEEDYQMEIPNVEDGVQNEFVERYALAVLYYATGGSGWDYSMNFLSSKDQHVCDWNSDFNTDDNVDEIIRLGVDGCWTLDGTDRFVTGLALPNNKLVGKLPNEIKFLHRLEFLQLQFNGGLTGPIPSGLAEMTHLADVQLQYCTLTGTLPDLSPLERSLTTLGLGNNLLTGDIPTTISRCTKLQVLGLDDNSLNGNIEIMRPLSGLRSLFLEDNAISGELTDYLLTGWTDLEELDLSKCGIHSTLPSGLFSHPSLDVIDLHSNKFHGTIPAVAKENTVLRFVALSDNQLGSTIPPTISNLKELTHLDLSMNQLTLPYPKTMNQLTNLRYLFVGQNPKFVNHPFPKFLEKLDKLRELSLKSNSVTGTIPDWLGNLQFLQLLDLDGNKLTGSIPEELGLSSGLDHVLLNRNQLNGTIPATFSLMTDLEVLLLDGNNFSGDASAICGEGKIDLTFFTADCAGVNPEIKCSCCNLCCNDNDPACNNLDWSVNLDPIWEYGFTRHVYKFGQEVMPVVPP